MNNYLMLLFVLVNILVTIIAIFFFKKSKNQEKECQNLANEFHNLCHDIKTPLASIMSGVTGIDDFLPQLISAYQSASQKNIIDATIQPRHLTILLNVLENMKSAVHQASNIVNEFSNKI